MHHETDPAINTLRKKIDSIDTQLIELLRRRMHAGQCIGIAKRATRRSLVFHPRREEQILDRLAREAPELASAIPGIWTEIFCASRALQDPRPVAVVDMPNGPVHLGTRLLLGRATRCRLCATKEEAEQLLLTGACALAALADGCAIPPSLRLIHSYGGLELAGALEQDPPGAVPLPGIILLAAVTETGTIHA